MSGPHSVAKTNQQVLGNQVQKLGTELGQQGSNTHGLRTEDLVEIGKRGKTKPLRNACLERDIKLETDPIVQVKSWLLHGHIKPRVGW